MVKYVGLHIHKCAGTTLQVHFTNELKYKFRHTNPIINYLNGLEEIDDISSQSKLESLAFWGHNVNQSMMFDLNQDIYLFTFLRHPVERIISWFNYEKREFNSNNSFEEFVTRRSNQMCELITTSFSTLVENRNDSLSKQAISVLEQFSFVGRQSHFSEDSKVLLDHMGLNPIRMAPVNVNSYYNIEDYDIELIKHFNNEDIDLYDYFFADNELKVNFNDNKTVNFFKSSLYKNDEIRFWPAQFRKLSIDLHDFRSNNLIGSVRNKKVRELVTSYLWMIRTAESESEQELLIQQLENIIELFDIKLDKKFFNRFIS